VTGDRAVPANDKRAKVAEAALGSRSGWSTAHSPWRRPPKPRRPDVVIADRRMPSGPLADIRVVELSSGIAGGYATKLFADAGADVIKVESPSGDPLRHWSASGADLGAADGALFGFLAASKRSVVGAPLDPDIAELIAGADLVVSDGGFGAAEDGLFEIPGLVVLSITPFGRGSLADRRPWTEFTLQASSGCLSQRGRPDGPPVQAGGRITEWASGVFGAPAALVAVRHARAGGPGAHIDVSMTEVISLCSNLFVDVMWSLLGRPEPMPLPARSVEFPSIEPSADGWVGFNTNTLQMFDDFLTMIERPDLRGTPGLRSDPARRSMVEASVQAWTTQHTTAEIIEMASLLRIPVAPIGNGRNLVDHEHLAARDVYATGGFTYPKPPYQLNGGRLDPPRPAPTLGADTGRISPRTKEPAGAGDGLPLAGLKVLDFTCWWAGPGATQFLAALGADVIHVESIQRIDGMRPAATIPFASRDRWWEYSSFFLNINVNKRGLTLNLDDPKGLALAKRLVSWADLVVENYTPRVMEKFGLDWPAVHALNPAAVMVRMPAFGLDGPWRDRVGFAQTMEEMSGLAWVSGFPDGPPVLPRGPCDPLGAMHGAFAIMVGLAARDGDGEGALLEVPLIESALNVAAEQVVEWSAYGNLLERDGNRSPGAAPQGVYACRGDEQWLALSIATDEQWRQLRSALGDPAWTQDHRLSGHDGRRLAQDDIDKELSAWAAERELAGAVELLTSHGVPAAAVVDYRAVSLSPQLNVRGFFETCEHPVVGSLPLFGLPFRYSGVDRWIRTPAPTLGQHNAEILEGVLGLTAEEIDQLAAEAVIGTAPLGL
jgi:crotonobetainyl-CoA:carnitine CoA-transferase CaiB-like acyl-CoA transferase